MVDEITNPIKFYGVPVVNVKEEWKFVFHTPSMCGGDHCCLHNPSEHKMKGWAMFLREHALIERLCEHGVGHPDPDSVDYMNTRDGFTPEEPHNWGMHGCCGCCQDDYNVNNDQENNKP